MELISCTIDTRGITELSLRAREYARRTPAIAVNTTAYVVTTLAYSKTKTVEAGVIETELAVEMIPAIGKRGKPLSTKSSKNRRYQANLEPVGEGEFAEVPLSWLLIGARAKIGSNYNKMTGNHWLIAGGVHPFKGHHRSEFAKIMQDYISRMVKGRNSHRGFIRSCWIKPMRTLADSGLVSPSALRGRNAKAVTSSQARRANPGPGWAIPARDGEMVVICEIANAAGMGEYNQVLAQKHNEVLWRIGLPALDEAINDETANLQTFISVQKEQFEKHFGGLRSKGFLVTA